MANYKPRAEEYVARNVAIEIAPGRYSRDTWVQERWFDRDEGKRASEGRSPKGKHIVVRPDAPKKKPGHMAKTRPDECPRRKGHYVFSHTELYHSKSVSFQVVGICKGGHCPGRIRKFNVNEWCKPTKADYACITCSNVMRREARLAARAARRAAGQPLINYIPAGHA